MHQQVDQLGRIHYVACIVCTTTTTTTNIINNSSNTNKHTISVISLPKLFGVEISICSLTQSRHHYRFPVQKQCELLLSDRHFCLLGLRSMRSFGNDSPLFVPYIGAIIGGVPFESEFVVLCFSVWKMHAIWPSPLDCPVTTV